MKRVRELGLKGRAVVYFTAFVLLTLCIVFFVQFGMLGSFYRLIKSREIRSIAEKISSEADSDTVDQTAYEEAIRYRTCILLFENDGGTLRLKASSDGQATCLIHHMPDDVLISYYREAEAGGGSLSRTIHHTPAIGQSSGGSEKSDEINNLISVYVFSSEAGGNYVLFLDTQMSPLNSSVSAMRSQTTWLTILLLLMAVVVSYVFAVRIATPLSKINESAKKLAAGDLNVKFEEKGYRETKELAKTLNYAASEIARSDRLQHELISNISHDLRTPLTMISGYAEIMRDIEGENTKENLQVIIDESKRLSDLVNDMLDLSKIEAGAKNPEMTEFNLTETVREVMGRYSALTLHDGFDISFASDEDVFVSADRTMILQVVYNLVNNAINYTGDDKKVEVVQSVKEENGAKKVRISVRDTGEGIPSEKIANIWDRYYKIDRTHKRSAVGSGLGLSIVREILQKHNALFGVESGKTKGTVFWFELDVLSSHPSSRGK